MRYDLAVLGELLIDFTPVGLSENGNPIFERNPGGGPANMACAAAKLGAKTAFLGKVGDDPFGRALKETLTKTGVDASRLLLSKEHPTTLAFVHLAEDGDRSFSFYRHGGADTMLTPAEVDLSLLDGSLCFFCSSVLMAEGPSRGTSFFLLEEAKKRGCTVIFDPNLRPSLWADQAEMKAQVLRALPYAGILKVSEEEALFLTGAPAVEEAAGLLYSRYSPALLCVTLGSEGSLALAPQGTIRTPGFTVRAADTTAAGDSFTGALAAAILAAGKPVSHLTREELSAALRTANAAGALTAARKGSICALPSREEVENLLNTQ